MTKQKLAVIGGGVGAVTAVYAITQTPDWQDKYDITVYQLGWRLGGKGASGRNAAYGQRIEEHGLHVWAGFYDNAFRNMRKCYDQLAELGLRDPDAPLGTMDKAFKPLSHLFLAERFETETSDNPWRPWVIDLPPNSKEPGSETHVPGPFEMMRRILEIVVEFLKNGAFNSAKDPRYGFHIPHQLHDVHHAIHSHAKSMPDDPRHHTPRQTNILADLIAAAQAEVHALETPENLADDPCRRGLFLADLALGYMYGMATSNAFTSGYDVLDQWEFSDFLRQSGTSDAALEWVAVRGCYDFVFGFPFGNTERQGNSGAGTAIRAMSRLIFTYSTAIFHKMQAGMGDTIFGPYYQVLRKLGVKFEFFCAARDLHLDADGIGIDRLSMVRQAAIKDGTYEPLVDVENLPCWPSEPLWDQLVDGEKLKADGVDFECEKDPPRGEAFELRRGEDFDVVLLGASLGSLPYLSGELSKASPRWRMMLDRVKTVGTHAAQFWLNRSADDLGWDEQVAKHNSPGTIPPPPMRTVITGFAEPLDTWADMSHLISREDWGANEPESIAYFCAPAPDGETLEGFDARVEDWTNEALPMLWPRAKKDGGFDPELFHDGKKAGRYTRVNMYGSERYVLSVAGSVFHRLSPSESGFDNLYLAGDWTRCGLNAGCVEAATMSGIAAASAITGVSLLNVGAEDIPDAGSLSEKAMFQTNSISGTHWPLTPFFARGEMTGWFFFYELPRSEVAAMLPDGIFLGHCPMTRPGYHPVGMSFCHYQTVRGSFIPDFLAMSPYGEATFAIPYTRTEEAGQTDFLYPRQLYVNSKSAIFAGRFFYAMPKEDATITVGNSHFTASDDKGLALDATFQQRRDPVALSGHPAHGAISDLLDMTFVTRRNSGRILYNAFDLQLDRAYVAPVTAEVETRDPSGGFPAANLRLRGLEPHATRRLPGAFRIWCSWSMTNPLDSRRVREAAEARAWVRRER
ncbi:acetoacetate decarboxylase family protein [Poseidonocella sedimentorum]|uniref:NAD-binding domain and a Fe-S cluster-containing protein n=1 Tax=Poseidonocella sedimentorum TaxID=871652 RepID=A0A1I6DFI5_9RHOB|nr:acetoacetate decarboxylase family protein [Poseidonocella sedimentorum]SFR04167.1 NAD-binding domain and a Fe-S cluster-containing protein [Poseidonocella sedimentorum]